MAIQEAQLLKNKSKFDSLKYKIVHDVAVANSSEDKFKVNIIDAIIAIETLKSQKGLKDDIAKEKSEANWLNVQIKKAMSLHIENP